MQRQEAETGPGAAKKIACKDLAMNDEIRQGQAGPMRACVRGVHELLPRAVFDEYEAFFPRREPNYIGEFALSLERSIGIGRPVLSSVGCGIQMAAVSVGTSEEPATMWIQEEQILHASGAN